MRSMLLKEYCREMCAMFECKSFCSTPSTMKSVRLVASELVAALVDVRIILSVRARNIEAGQIVEYRLEIEVATPLNLIGGDDRYRRRRLQQTLVHLRDRAGGVSGELSLHDRDERDEPPTIVAARRELRIQPHERSHRLLRLVHPVQSDQRSCAQSDGVFTCDPIGDAPARQHQDAIEVSFTVGAPGFFDELPAILLRRHWPNAVSASNDRHGQPAHSTRAESRNHPHRDGPAVTGRPGQVAA